MATINLLGKDVYELIAAGEVIERPASVIKELVENSIDAGATHITVEIKNGGTLYMRVTDDGCGMSYDDVPKAFLRHATSKISKKSDLDNIYTLGFRGEALASVSAVSKVETMTKKSGDLYGTLYKIEGSTERLHERSGCPDGTTMIVRDLFYNVPARRKFMKRDVTESNAVSNILQKITLSHPEISFKLVRDNRTEFNSSGDGELFSAVYAIYGRDFARDLIEVNYEYENIKISGYVIKPLYARNNRTFQNFFVNGRYVKSRICSIALESAFSNMIMTGKFPACVLMLDLLPSSVDVNIHPAKAEVRFTDEKTVADAIYFAVKNALLNNGLIYEFELRPRTDWTKETESEEKELPQQEFMFTPVDKITEVERKIEQSDAENTDIPKIGEDISGLREGCSEKSLPESSNMGTTDPEDRTEYRYIGPASFSSGKSENTAEKEKTKENNWHDTDPQLQVIGEAFKNYIIAEIGEQIIIIDKHAAHERIIFERLKNREGRQYSQMLITEVKVLLPLTHFDALESNTDLLEDMGFVFDFSEKPFVIAKAVPVFVMELELEEIISEIAENLYLGKKEPQTHVLDDMLHTIACRSAIKANDINDIKELQSLAEQVYYDEKIRHCPHGRPVMFTMSKSNIEHQFRRT